MFILRLPVWERCSRRIKRKVERVGLCFAVEAEWWSDKSRQAKKATFIGLHAALLGVSLCCANEIPPLNTFFFCLAVPVAISSFAPLFQCMPLSFCQLIPL